MIPRSAKAESMGDCNVPSFSQNKHSFEISCAVKLENRGGGGMSETKKFSLFQTQRCVLSKRSINPVNCVHINFNIYTENGQRIPLTQWFSAMEFEHSSSTAVNDMKNTKWMNLFFRIFSLFWHPRPRAFRKNPPDSMQSTPLYNFVEYLEA